MRLTCAHCRYDWEYKGHSEYYATCPKCLPGDVIVAGDFVPISQITLGSTAIGQSGQQPVAVVHRHQFEGELVRVKTHGTLPLELTPEHPVFVSHMIDGRLTVPHWLPAERLAAYPEGDRGDFLLVPVGGHRFAARGPGIRDPRFVWLNGRVGNVTNSFRLRAYSSSQPSFTTPGEGPEEIDVHLSPPLTGRPRMSAALEKSGLVKSISENIGSSGLPDATFAPSSLSSLINEVHLNAQHGIKKTDFRLYLSDVSLLTSLLRDPLAWNDLLRLAESQGSPGASRAIALRLQLLCAESGVFLPVKQTGGVDGSASFDRRVLERVLLEASGEGERIDTVRMGANGIWLPVLSVERVKYNGEVYNLETPDHTFLASNVLVHNCLYKVRIYRKGRKRGKIAK